MPVTYPVLWRKFLIAFSFSYLMERGFGAVVDLLTEKETNWISEAEEMFWD